MEGAGVTCLPVTWPGIKVGRKVGLRGSRSHFTVSQHNGSAGSGTIVQVCGTAGWLTHLGKLINVELSRIATERVQSQVFFLEILLNLLLFEIII